MTSKIAEGFNIPAVEAWIGSHIKNLSPPFRWTKLPGGHSNLTYRLTDVQDRQAVVRRPPLGELLPNAHDMTREWAIISSLGSTSVPVPEAWGLCEDISITGAYFYVMELVEGHPLYTIADNMERVPQEKRVVLAHSLFDVLADIHSLVPDDVGLGNLGKKDGYLSRQLKTWYRSWTSSIEPAQFDDRRAHKLQEMMLQHMPEQGMARIVHGDYGLHNCLIGKDHTVVAVLDWEISTLGDPLADLAYALNPWGEPDDPVVLDPENAAMAPGMPSRSEIAERYSKRTGRSIDHLDYYVGFSRWKSAAIMHGVYARYIAGQKSSDGVDLDAWKKRISTCLETAEHAISRYVA